MTNYNSNFSLAHFSSFSKIYEPEMTLDKICVQRTTMWPAFARYFVLSRCLRLFFIQLLLIVAPHTRDKSFFCVAVPWSHFVFMNLNLFREAKFSSWESIKCREWTGRSRAENSRTICWQEFKSEWHDWRTTRLSSTQISSRRFNWVN